MRAHVGDELMQHAAQLLAQARHAVALTGAGLSTPSGIPDFRSRDTGLWENYDPLEIATFHAFRRRPADFFNWIRPLARQMFEAQPNLAHHALAELQQAGRLPHIITQNIDGLQQRAGAQHVIELHGDIFTGTCVSCYTLYHSTEFRTQFIDAGHIPTCPHCGNIIKPNVILYGEALPVRALMAAKRAVANCDVLLIAGSSLEVAPASDLPMLARSRQARLIIVNQGTTYVDDYCDVLIHADVAVALPAIAALCLPGRSVERPIST
ncbi:NAD-dependent histone deacetylase SIR2 [Thermoflexales bacterium]|nr:NAD-dependent histone deacetylase SIR2 [Thermoflexales bacterium]